MIHLKSKSEVDTKPVDTTDVCVRGRLNDKDIETTSLKQTWLDEDYQPIWYSEECHDDVA